MSNANEQDAESAAPKTSPRVLPHFRSPAIEAFKAESKRRARWTGQIHMRHPFAEVADQLKPFADMATRLDKQLAPFREAMASMGKQTRAQQDALAAASRKVQITGLERLAEPRDSIVDTVQSIQDAKAEREAEQHANQTATVELLRDMLRRQDEILRRQDEHLAISRQAVEQNRGDRAVTHLAAFGALAAALVVIAPTLLTQLLALAAAAATYLAVRFTHTFVTRRQARRSRQPGSVPTGPPGGTATPPT